MVIHWIMLGSKTSGSSRIHGYRIHERFIADGYNSRLLVSPPSWVEMDDVPWEDPVQIASTATFRPGDCVIFQTVRGPNARRLAAEFQKRGIRVVFVECDLLLERSQIAAEADVVVCASEALANEYERFHHRPVVAIDDAVEDWLDKSQLQTRTRPLRSNLQLAWVGNRHHWSTLDPIRDALARPEFADYRLVTISDHPKAQIKWSVSGAMASLRSCDVAVVPTAATPYARVKSVNRVSQAMALGAPVAAGRIQSYVNVITPGETGFLCETPDEWAGALRSLRAPEVREQLMLNGFNAVIPRYTLDRIAPLWLDVCTDGVPSKARASAMDVPRPNLPLRARGEFFIGCSRGYYCKGRYLHATASLCLGAFMARSPGRAVVAIARVARSRIAKGLAPLRKMLHA